MDVTPAMIDPLHSDKDGNPFSEDWAYDVVIGMHMQCIKQAARFTYGSRKSQDARIKHIVRYLNRTKTEGFNVETSLVQAAKELIAMLMQISVVCFLSRISKIQ